MEAISPCPDNAVLSRLRAHLERHAVRHEVFSHAPAASAQDYHRIVGSRLDQQPKALVIRYKGGEAGRGFALVALQAHKKADLDAMARLVGAREAKLATADQLRDITGLKYGEVPPFGSIFGVPLLMDRDLLSQDRLFFNAGSLTTSISLAPDDLVRIEAPQLF